ncbi:hypothetical protein J1N35_046115 [Gossypium stocksii]|uniref:NAD(P)H-quinone oxidoreductase subunit O, chloroplastic n=1 Tax=Gossypium stocksii TaxID=47602 RepID=A0A9D3ZDU0_9ROSI|nr:hypothetical protein J1N35_046115 [Gossypium stocksii]
MAFSSSALSHTSSSCLSSFPHAFTTRKTHLRFPSFLLIKASSEPDKGNPTATQTKNAEGSSNAQPQPQPQATPAAAAKPPPKKPVYSVMKKGQIVKVDKDKYLNSINYLSVGHPPYYKGLDYIYEDRGEVLDVRIFETGEHALVAWVGIPTAPAWLPTDMLIKVLLIDCFIGHLSRFGKLHLWLVLYCYILNEPKSFRLLVWLSSVTYFKS